MNAGTVLSESDLQLADVSKTLIPKGVFRTVADAQGRIVILPIVAGEPLVETRIAPRGAGMGLAPIISPGSRAVAVRVNDVVGVAGFVLPGMRVDVLVTGRAPGSEDSVTRTVLRDILVLSAGQIIQPEPKAQTINTPVVTLQVTPAEAEVLTLASAEGHIQLVLRNSSDRTAPETAGVRLTTLLAEAPREHSQLNPRAVARKPLALPHPVVPVPSAATSRENTVEVIRRTERSDQKLLPASPQSSETQAEGTSVPPKEARIVHGTS
jgi:pilus assembly protein CpaB